jgi:hypothetical protein
MPVYNDDFLPHRLKQSGHSQFASERVTIRADVARQNEPLVFF